MENLLEENNSRLRFMSVAMDSSSFIQFDVPEYSSTVLSQLNELRLQGKLCDIIVHIQGQPFRAHKAVLAASSPYFRDHSALSTMSGLSISVIKNPNVFEQLLSFCYTGRMSLQLKDVVSFLTAASFLQMQCVIDKCTQILESIHSKISVGDVDSVTVGAEETPESQNGVKDGGFFANPVEISPPYCSQGRQPTTSSDLRMETTPSKALRSRLQEEGHSDRGSSGSVSEYEIQIEGDHDQGDLLVRESQITEVKVKMEKSDRPSCSDSSSLGDDGYHTEMVDGEQVVAVNVGSYGSVLQHAYSFSQAASQPTSVSEAFGSLSNSSPSRSMLSCFRGGRARQKRALSVHLHSDLQGWCRVQTVKLKANHSGFEGGSAEASTQPLLYLYSEKGYCRYCDFVENEAEGLELHVLLEVCWTRGPCPHLGKGFARETALEHSLSGLAQDHPGFCVRCCLVFPSKGRLIQHREINGFGSRETRDRLISPFCTRVYGGYDLCHQVSGETQTLDSMKELHSVSDRKLMLTECSLSF
ncbi:hypothetical protein QTO34_005137 [Cnephaeus nilssonii]|uniref:BTB domain-containing protein n=1 Tax=Cnephaeus nilssonii TaxID=3371016 RepID=A0AA40HNU1_CNENI|nr:hypothetical protein QTO34_005137 [Eptesicus nilssonii]